MRSWYTWLWPGAIGLFVLAVSLGPDRYVLLAVAVVLTGAMIAAWVTGRRRRRLAEWAATTPGWAYWPQDPSLLNISFRFPFGTGESRSVTEVLRGTFAGREAASFLYTYTERAGRGAATYRFHVVAMRLPQCLPVVEVVPEGIASRAETALGAQDMRFESEAFNRAYRIQARHERAAHAIIQPLLMERLLRPDARDVAWRIDGDWVLSWRSGATDLDTLAARLSVLAAVVSSVPQFVWQDYGYGPFPDPDR